MPARRRRFWQYMKNLLSISLALLLCSCVGPPGTGVDEEDLTLPPAPAGACARPLPGEYAAADLQAALDGAGCLELSAGTYLVDTPVVAAPKRRPIAMLTVGSGESIRGAGVGTVLLFTGDVGASDWYGVNMTGQSPQVENLTVASTVTNASEQTHAIQVTGPSTGATIAGVTFVHQPMPDGGDCVKVVGYAAGKMVIGMTLSGSQFLACRRSGLGVHSGLQGLSLTGNQFIAVTKDDVASEDGDAKSDWAITGNSFLSPGGDSGVVLVATDRVAMAGNVHVGRGIYAFGGDGLSITGSTVIKTSGPTAAIQLEKGVRHAVIGGDYVVRTAAAGVGGVVNLAHHGTDAPAHVLITGSVLRQEVAAAAFNSSSSSDVSLVNDDIELTATSGGNTVGTTFTGIISPATRILVSGCRFQATSATPILTLAVVRISGSYTGTGAVSVVGNMATGFSQGLRCEAGPGGITGPIVSAGNNWAPNAAGCVTTAGQ